MKKDRKCTTCRNVYPLSIEHFRRVKSKGFHGFMYRCRPCDNDTRGRSSKRRYVGKRREYHRKYSGNVVINHPEKVSARSKARLALKRGTIKKQVCSKCGNVKVDMHHQDYSKPVEIIWLCRRHHQQEHYRPKK